MPVQTLIEAGYTEQQNQGHKNESHKVHLPGKQKKQENDTRRGKIQNHHYVPLIHPVRDHTAQRRHDKQRQKRQR